MDKWDFWQIIIGLFCLVILGIMGFLMISSVSSAEISEIEQFLIEDQTDKQKYLPWHTCGHYSRALAKNATNHNLTIGSVILGYHPTLRGYQNHIMNYVIVNGSILLIESQTDHIMKLNDTMYSYYRLYPDGSHVPTYWKHNLATEMIK